MILILLYSIVFLVILTGIIILPWSGMLSLKDALWRYEHFKKTRWIDNAFDMAGGFLAGILQISCGIVFAFIGYQMILELIRILGE